MSVHYDLSPVTFTEDRIPVDGIEEAIPELVDLYGGEMKESRDRERSFVLPLRRGVAAGGGVECTVSWSEAAAGEAVVTLTCDRDVDAPKVQRILLLAAGVVGALLFTLWPFFPQQREFGVLAWIGGAIALAVYFLSLRKTSGGIAYDFLQRLAKRQRAMSEE
jgi:hypothetical protein